MEDWKEKVEDKLKSFDYPIDIGDLCRIVGLSVDNMSEMYVEIARITKSLAGTPYALVVEEGKCLGCYRSARFTGKYNYTCTSCGGFVTPPKVCINLR